MQKLKDGIKDEWTGLHMFNVVSDVQPVSALEMPRAYMNNPNARILYTLKSYTIKQLDIARRTIVDPARTKGERMEAAKNLATFAAYVGGINGVVTEGKDWMATGEFRPEDIPDNIVEALGNLVFLGKYNRDTKLSEGEYVKWMVDNVTPATPDIDPDDPAKVVKAVPVVGRIAYDWMFGGKDKRVERERLERVRELTER